MKFRFLISSAVTGILFLVAGTLAWTQNTYPRLSVVEEFSSATCGPCVAASTALKEVVDMEKNGILSIRFHMNWPAPGDPWNVENPTQNDERRNFYSVTSIPYGRVNGTVVNVQSSSAVLTKAQADNAEGSPIKIDVSEVKSGSKYDVTVKVTTNIALTNHKLLVGVVSRHCPYPNLPSQLPNSNGEDEFYDAMNKMLGYTNGNSINIGAGSDQTFTYSYSRGTGNTWPADQQYIIAYVQDATTLKVLNVGTNLKLIRPTLEMVSPVWEKIDKGASSVKTIKVSNPTDKEMVCTLEVVNADNLAQSGWTATLASPEAVIPANGSVNVTINNTAPTRALFAGIQLSATPVVKDGIPEGASIVSGYLTNGSKVGVFYGATNGAPGNMIPALASTYGQDAAYMPLDNSVLAAFPVDQSFEAIVLPCGFDGRFAITALTPIAQQMLNANKGVWLNAPLGLAVALNDANQGYAGYPEAKAFFESYGLSLKNTVNRNDGQYITQFPVAGVANDPIGKGWTATANNASQQWPFYTQAQDIIQLQSGKTKSFVYADGNTSNIVGVRYEEASTKKRFVYTSFGPEVIGKESERNLLMQRVLDYLMPKTQSSSPIISVSTDKLSFGSVDVNSSLDKSVTITNTGTANLELSETSLNGADAATFEIVSGAIDAGKTVTVLPNAAYVVKIRFKPTAEKNGYTATLVVGGNAPSQTVQLSGNGVIPQSVATDVVSETGAISLKLVGSNPIVSNSSVELKAASSVSVLLIDNAGNTVATLFTGTPAGTQIVPINAAAIASGTYNVVATNGSERATLSVVVVH